MITICFSAREDKPQTLLFSATLPPWVVKTAEKYMSDDRKIVDLIGEQELKASENVQVRQTRQGITILSLVLDKLTETG